MQQRHKLTNEQEYYILENISESSSKLGSHIKYHLTAAVTILEGYFIIIALDEARKMEQVGVLLIHLQRYFTRNRV